MFDVPISCPLCFLDPISTYRNLKQYMMGLIHISHAFLLKYVCIKRYMLSLSFGSLLGKYFSLKQRWIYGNLSLSLSHNLLLFQILFVMKLKRLGVKFGTVKLVSHNRHSCYSKVYYASKWRDCCIITVVCGG